MPHDEFDERDEKEEDEANIDFATGEDDDEYDGDDEEDPFEHGFSEAGGDESAF
jgi:hypothetical protein